MFTTDAIEIDFARKKRLFGKLQGDVKGGVWSYGLYDVTVPEYWDLERYLKKHYMADRFVFIKIQKGATILFKGVGKLYKKKIWGSTEWFLGEMVGRKDFCIGGLLFNNVDEVLEVIIGEVQRLGSNKLIHKI